MPSDLMGLVALVMMVAAFVQAAAGFGFALVAVAILSMLAPLTQATPLLAAVDVPVLLYVLWRLRGSIPWGELATMAPGVLLGVPFGVHVLVSWPQEVLLRILAAVLLGAAARTVLAARGRGGSRATPQHGSVLRRAVGFCAGCVSGALGGAFGTSGPPLVAYVYCQPWSKEKRTAALQSLFLLVVACSIPIFWSKGLYDAALVRAIGACLPGAAVGMVLGHLVFRRIPHRVLEVLVACFLAAVGVKLLIWG